MRLCNSVPEVIVASFPGLPRFFCSSVSVDNNTWMRKGSEKQDSDTHVTSVSPESRVRPRGIKKLLSLACYRMGYTFQSAKQPCLAIYMHFCI